MADSTNVFDTTIVVITSVPIIITISWADIYTATITIDSLYVGTITVT